MQFTIDNISTMCYNAFKEVINMEKTELLKLWRKILIDEDLSAAEFWKKHGLNEVVWNRKMRLGTVKYIEFVNILESLGYEVTIKKKKGDK